MARPKKTVAAELPLSNVSDTYDDFKLTPEEVDAIKALRASKNSPTVDTTNVGMEALAKAFASAIESTRPPVKKTPFNRKPKYTGPTLKRAWQQHGGEIDFKQLYPDEIELLNQVKPGIFCKGLVHIIKNKDRSYNITWPVKTAAQRLRVLNEAGGTFALILKRCLDEHNDPKKFRGPDDDNDD